MEALIRRLLLFVSVLAGFRAGLTGCKEATGVNTHPGPAWVSFNHANGQLSHDDVRALYTDAENVVWVGTDSGASYFRGGIWSWDVDDITYWVYSNPDTIVKHTITSITQTLDRSLWFGTYGGGIFRYNEFGPKFIWKQYTIADQLPSDVILGLAQSQTPAVGLLGEVWCATTAGVGHFVPQSNQGGNWTSYDIVNSPLPSSSVYALAYNYKEYSVWFATYLPVSLIHVDESDRWTPSTAIPAPYNVTIDAMAFDLSGILWMGNVNGVWSLNTNTNVWQFLTNASTNGKLPLARVNAVTTNFSTTRWFGTDAGLVRFEDTTWTTFTHATTPQLPSDTITALTYDQFGNLWIGTPDGLAVYNENGTRF